MLNRLERLTIQRRESMNKRAGRVADATEFGLFE